MDSSTFISDEAAWSDMATGYYLDGGVPRAVSKEVPKYVIDFWHSGANRKLKL